MFERYDDTENLTKGVIALDKWAFFLDIDGTTAVGGRVSDENIKAINDAVKNGHYVFICTGRPYSTSKQLLDTANLSGLISSMGAEIIINGEFARKERVSAEFARYAVEKLLKTNFWAFMGNGENLLAINADDNSPYMKIKTMQDFEKYYSGITKIDMPADITDDVKAFFEREMDIICHPGYAEASVKGMSKSGGIEFVLNKLGLDRNFSVAVGDSLNDIDMIQYAGIGVAMGNAIDEVKSVADRITDICEENGVAKIIREITGIC